jgi:hypothetical protein
MTPDDDLPSNDGDDSLWPYFLRTAGAGLVIGAADGIRREAGVGTIVVETLVAAVFFGIVFGPVWWMLDGVREAIREQRAAKGSAAKPPPN